jgi:hypothetical protein
LVRKIRIKELVCGWLISCRQAVRGWSGYVNYSILDLIDCNLSGSDWLQIALALIGCLVDGPSR